MLTLAQPAQAELERIKGSRFLADAAPAVDESAARVFIEAVQAREPSASHHCWAFRLHGGRCLTSDDGEPRDSAGAPILRHLEGADLENVVVVVSRWFGGTKLGRGGLVRAYGDAAAAVLAGASHVRRDPMVTLVVEHAYDLTGVVDGALAEVAAEVVESDYGLRVRRMVVLAEDVADPFRSALREATSGRVEARDPDD